MPLVLRYAHSLRTEMDLSPSNWRSSLCNAALLGRACGFLIEHIPMICELRINHNGFTVVMQVPLDDTPADHLQAMADDTTQALECLLDGKPVELHNWKR